MAPRREITARLIQLTIQDLPFKMVYSTLCRAYVQYMTQSTVHIRDRTQIIKQQGGLIFMYHQLSLHFIGVRTWDNSNIIIQFDSNLGNRDVSGWSSSHWDGHMVQPCIIIPFDSNQGNKLSPKHQLHIIQFHLLSNLIQMKKQT